MTNNDPHRVAASGEAGPQERDPTAAVERVFSEERAGRRRNLADVSSDDDDRSCEQFFSEELDAPVATGASAANAARIKQSR
jgi:hypothetical protein